MDKIYLKHNYIVVEEAGSTYVFPKYYTIYTQNADNILLSGIVAGVGLTRTISIASIGSYYDEAGTTAWTLGTLELFLRENTGFKSPSAGGGTGLLPDGDYGDITVAGGGSTMTIDPLVVGNSKISDVDGSKVTQSSSYRLATDSQIASWSSKVDPTRLLTINGVSQDLSADRTWTIPAVNPSRTLTINGVSQDLSADRTWNIPTDPVNWTTIIKSSDQDTGTQGVNDTELQFSAVANGVYLIEFCFIMSSNNANADSRYYFRTNTATLQGAATFTNIGNTFGGGTQLMQVLSNWTAVVAMGTPPSQLLDYPLTATGRITLKILANDTIYAGFGINALFGGAITRMWKGSFIRYVKIA